MVLRVVLLFTYKKDGWAKYGCLGAIFGCFWALRGAPKVADGWCATPGQWWSRTNKKDLTFDGLKGAVSLFTYKKDGQANLGYHGGIFGHWEALEGPLGWQIEDAPPQEGGKVEKNQKDVTYDSFKGVAPLFTYKKKNGRTKSGYCDGVSFCFGALMWGPWVDGWVMHHPGGWRLRMNQKYFTFDGLKRADPLFSYKKRWLSQICLS